MKRKELLEKLNLSTFIAFDFETTGLDSKIDKIIEVAAIKFVDGELTERYVELVNPGMEIPHIITEITGISNSMVSSSPSEELIVDDLLAFISDYPLVAHNIHFDKRFLSQLCKRLGRENVDNVEYDTLQLARSVLFEQPVFNLGALSEYFNLSSKGAHRAESDTENTGIIFLKLLDELSKYSLDIISKVNGIIKGTGIPNQKLYSDLATELTKKGDVKSGLKFFTENRQPKQNTYMHSGENNVLELSADDVFGVNGLLSKSHPNFENRPNQQRYASLVDEMINNNEAKAVIEAGTGLGKSMAYLFGAIKRSVNFEQDGPTIIACHTKHLQDQLFQNDLPMLAEALDAPLKALMLKGRRNYLCKTRFNWLTSDARTMDSVDLEALIPIVFWMNWTNTGDLSECSGFFNARRTWLKAMISSDSGYCTGDICSRNDGCYYGKLKRATFQAQIIVVNHSLLMTDVAQKGFLPEYGAVIIDEAHNLIKSAYDQFKIDWNEQESNYYLQSVDPSFPRSARWNNIIQSINDINPEIGEQRDKLKDVLINARVILKKMMTGLSQENENRFSPHNTYQDQPILANINKVHSPIYNDILDMKNILEIILVHLNGIQKIVLEIDNKRKDYPILHSALDRGLDTIHSMIGSLMALTEDQDSDWVYWMEGEYRGVPKERENLRISLHTSMIDVSDKLFRTFFDKIDSCILTSATLKVQNSFDYFLRRVGLENAGNVVTKEFLSPFHYNEQVVYYQYGGSRELSNSPEGIGDVVYNLHKTYDKRILVLFTSIKTLTDTAKYIRSKFNGRDLPLFAQVRGASKPSIIRGMHQTHNGILFGTNSFWEGVDFPGDLLEILVLVKLPFDVPSEPLVKSYSEYVNKNGGNSFMDYSLPETAIRFRQGFGRLIRTSYDSGKFICLDNRIVLKRYGNILSQSLPVEMKVFSQLDSFR
ncbi:MAG: helicase C-terminal domain-containing protein [Candidatus Neomarinimicrobiota bacterium]